MPAGAAPVPESAPARAVAGRAARGKPPLEYLDEDTGATVTVVDKPMLFSRERSERVANLRDFVSLTAASVSRGGKVEYVLIAYVWSTLDPRYAPDVIPETLALAADDRRFNLNASGQTPSDLGIVRPVQAPLGQDVEPFVVSTDLATLRFISASGELSVRALQRLKEGADVTEDPAVRYDIFEDQRPALARFVSFVEGDR